MEIGKIDHLGVYNTKVQLKFQDSMLKKSKSAERLLITIESPRTEDVKT